MPVISVFTIVLLPFIGFGFELVMFEGIPLLEIHLPIIQFNIYFKKHPNGGWFYFDNCIKQQLEINK